MGDPMISISQDWRTPLKLKLALVLGALLLAACGSAAGATSPSTTAATTDSTSSPAVDVDAAVTAYTECLRDNGVDVADPEVGEDGNLIPPSIPGFGRSPDGASGSAPEDGTQPDPGSGPDESARAALETCMSLLNGTEYANNGPGGLGGDFEEMFTELAACLSEQGIEVDIPDPGARPGTPPEDQNPPEPPGNGGQTPPEQPGNGGPGRLFGLDMDDPDVQAALEQCGDLVPDFGGGPGFGSGHQAAPPSEDS